MTSANQRFGMLGAWLLAVIPRIGVTMALTLPALAAGATHDSGTTPRPRLQETWGNLPLAFERNQGQTDARVKFLARGSGLTLFLTGTEAIWKGRGRRGTLRMRLARAAPDAEIEAFDPLPGKSNYLIGSDPARHVTGVGRWTRVRYRQIYPGIDLAFQGSRRLLEYQFTIAPGARPESIRIAYSGAESMRIDAQGDLLLAVAGGELRQQAPRAYQLAGTTQQPVAVRFRVRGRHEVSFETGVYDEKRPLVIDPVLSYSSPLGGSGFDAAYAIATDREGSVYLTGETDSVDFPLTRPVQGQVGGSVDVVVTKVNASGSAVAYSTYLGGSGWDTGYGIAVDAAGNAYVAGSTNSSDFPTANAFQAAPRGSGDAFVVKLNPTGDALVYSTYLGGTRDDSAYAIAVDSSGEAYMTGGTSSTNFPLARAVQTSYAGGNVLGGDAFFAKLNAAGDALLFSTYLGGSNMDVGNGIAVDASGNAYVAGETRSVNFRTANPLQAVCGCRTVSSPFGDLPIGDAFVAKFDPTAGTLVYSTFLGGNELDAALGIAVDASGNAYVAGDTSSGFPTVNPLQTYPGDNASNPFVTKINPSGSALVYSTYFGGNGIDSAHAIAADATGAVYIAGETRARDFPTAEPIQPAFGGGTSDGFIAKIDPSGAKTVYSSYLGGGDLDIARAIAVDANGNAFVAGYTYSTDFPRANAFQAAHGGSVDAFVAKVSGVAPLATVSTASYVPGESLAPESIASAFGQNLATRTESATALPLPTTLAGTTVKVKDSAGGERDAPLFFVSPGQINFLIPEGTQRGAATVTVTSQAAVVATGPLQIGVVGPGLFAANANGEGVAAALATRVAADGSQSTQLVFQCGTAPLSCAAIPIDLGAETDQVILLLFGTGIRGRSALAGVTATIGGTAAEVLYAGAQGGYVGLDQVNVRVPRSLAGRGEVDVVLTVDGKTANTVRVNIK